MNVELSCEIFNVHEDVGDNINCSSNKMEHVDFEFPIYKKESHKTNNLNDFERVKMNE